MLLITTMLVPLAAALLIAAMPARAARALASVASLVFLGLTLATAFQFDWSQGQLTQLGYSVPWLPQAGLSFTVGVDAIGLLLILLTGLLAPICVFASYTAITDRLRTYYAWLMVLQSAMVGVFAAQDLILFYICFEFTLVPMYVLINLFGSTNRKHAATKFFLYTFTGSIIALAGLVFVAAAHAKANGGEWTFAINELAATARGMDLSTQGWLLLALMAGFAVKVPLFPVHTWLPLAHTEAPTAGSVVLAGVLLKLGTYAIYRFVLPFVPAAVWEYSVLLAALCIVGVLYGGLICWVQDDVKKLVAYSSVAHLGFCMLGMFALNGTGITGSVLYMINHGLSTGALFLLIGFMYERYHTRSLREVGGLGAKMPVWSTFMVFFAMASVGLPGLNGFVGEFLCMLGAFQASSAWGSGVWGSLGQRPVGATPGNLGPWFAIIAGTGVIVAAIYLLKMVGGIVWGQLKEPAGHDHGHSDAHADGHGSAKHDAHAGHLPADLTWREIGVLTPLALLCLGLGVYPKPLLNAVEDPVRQTVLDLNLARVQMQERGIELIDDPTRAPTPAIRRPAVDGGEGAGEPEAGAGAAAPAREVPQ